MLKTNIHDIHMRKILTMIYQDKNLQNSLGFKGGTCLYFFHNLDRFSTDLDFDCIGDSIDVEAMNALFSDYGIQDHYSKFNTWFWLLSYEKVNAKIKIEISKRDYPDTYEIVDFLGTPIRIMTKDCMFAHKLCAITDRKKLQNRDLYDTYFMLKHFYSINENILKLRTGKTIKEYFLYLLEFIEQKVDNKHILAGLGEVLDDKQKDWARENLVKKLIITIKIHLA